VTQFHNEQPASSPSYAWLSRTATLMLPTLADDASGTASAALSPVAASSQRSFSVSLSSILSPSAVHPKATGDYAGATLSSCFQARALGTAVCKDLVATWFCPGSQNSAGPFPYGDPVGWEGVLSLKQYFQASWFPWGPSAGFEDLAERAQAVLELPLSPPRNPKIDGQDAYQDVTVATQTPTFSWEAPARGTPSRYSAAVYRGGQSARAHRDDCAPRHELQAPPREPQRRPALRRHHHSR
jgi:hypothetical protein